MSMGVPEGASGASADALYVGLEIVSVSNFFGKKKSKKEKWGKKVAKRYR